MSGTWTAIVLGFGGMRCDADGLSFDPVLPAALSRVSFGLRWQGRQIRVTITQGETEYRLVSGAPMRLRHHEEPVALDDEPVTLPVPAVEWVEPVEQPHGRAPRHRG